MSLDYLSSNARNKYPFDDSSSLKAADNSYLSNDVFLDIVFAAKKEAITGAFLSTLSSNGTAFTVVFTYFDSSEATVSTISLSIPFASVLDKQFFGQANTDVAVKIVFGSGFVDLKSAGTFSKTYTILTARLVQSAVILMVPRVTSIAFYNWDAEENEAEDTALVTIAGDEDTEIDLTLVEGANLVMTQDDDKTRLVVISGAGTGLYDNCPDDGLVVRTINDVEPTENGNFLFTADDCYVLEPGENTVSVENICTPKCTTDQIMSFAHYTNRIIDGLGWVRDFAVNVHDDIQDEVDRYVDEVEPTKNAPYYKIETTKIAGPGSKFYHSAAFGFFNPTTSPISIVFTASSAATIKLARYSQGNTTTLNTTSVNTTIPCLSMATYEFVFFGNAGSSGTLTGTFAGDAFSETVTP